MEIGDLVRVVYGNNNSIGVIVEERVLVDRIHFLYKVDWLDGNSYLVEPRCLEVLSGDR